MCVCSNRFDHDDYDYDYEVSDYEQGLRFCSAA